VCKETGDGPQESKGHVKYVRDGLDVFSCIIWQLLELEFCELLQEAFLAA